MEPQEEKYYYNCKENKCPIKRNCLGIVATILLVSLAAVLGLIFGAVFSATILAALPAIIVLAVVLAILLLIIAILINCNKKQDKKCKCC